MDSQSPCSHWQHLQILRVVLAAIIAVSGLLVAGCARYPENGGPINAPDRTLYVEMEVRGEINPAYNYFIVLGLDQNDASGPVPDADGDLTGTGFALIEPASTPEEEKPPFYVAYGLGSGTFNQFRLNPATGRYDALGLPYRSGLRQVGDRLAILWVEIDQQQFIDPFLLGVANPIAQLNIITIDRLNPPLGQQVRYDGLGYTGKEYITPITLRTQATLDSGFSTNPEPSYQNESTPSSLADLDIIDWRVEVRVGQSS